jgi:hypothetical protein
VLPIGTANATDPTGTTSSSDLRKERHGAEMASTEEPSAWAWRDTTGRGGGTVVPAGQIALIRSGRP